MIDPSSNAYYRWLAILSIAIIYNTVIVLPRAVFDELQEGDYIIAWFVFDYISDFMYIIDMVSFTPFNSIKVRELPLEFP